jgi:hypothetical protein
MKYKVIIVSSLLGILGLGGLFTYSVSDFNTGVNSHHIESEQIPVYERH